MLYAGRDRLAEDVAKRAERDADRVARLNVVDPGDLAGGDQATRTSRLMAFYRATDQSHDGSTIGHAAPEFWRKAFKAAFAPAEAPALARRGPVVSTEIDPEKYARVTVADVEDEP